MNRLVAEIAARVRADVQTLVGNVRTPNVELRSVFHGPPADLLRLVFDELVRDGYVEALSPNGEPVLFPVLLQVERLERGERNPEIGRSGICDENHLLALRNSPSCPRFLALVPPGRHRNLSVLSATNDFGLSPDSNAGNATIEQWWRDDFIQSLVDRALERSQWNSESDREQARRLIERAVRAADEFDRHDVSRRHAWAVLCRIFSISRVEMSFGSLVSLACGFPPLSDGSVRAEEQVAILEQLADALEDVGFRQGVERLKERGDEHDAQALGECLEHLERTCEVPTAFSRATSFFYSPSRQDAIGDVPSWWAHLTVERWAELLEEDSHPQGALHIRCSNSIIPPSKGINALVLSGVELELRLPDEEIGAITGAVKREAGGAAKRLEWKVVLAPVEKLSDLALPVHRSPVRYTAEAPGFRKASLKLVSLQTWAPGVFVFCRTAKKISAPKKAKANREGISFECSLILSGQGRHYIDVYVGPNVKLAETASGRDAGGLSETLMHAVVSNVSEYAYGFEVDATEACHYDVEFRRNDSVEKLRLQISCDESVAEGCKSEFERLIRLNRQRDQAGGASDVQIDRQARISDLQTWIIELNRAERSFYPLVLAPDYASAWRAPEFREREDSVFSRGKFLHDPRPALDEMRAPDSYVSARAAISARLRREDGSGLIEAAPLGIWLASEPTFAELIEEYVRSYVSWLDAQPEAAAWADIILVNSMEADGKTLMQEPDAALVSPLHPLRLGWHCLAQRALYVAYQRNMPCPAASILDPDCVPDVLVLPLRTATGEIRRQIFFGVECSSDYWAVLWNANRLDRLAMQADRPPLDLEFGVRIGGVSSGFSVSQVERALDDVTIMLSAKPVLNVAVSSATGQNDACNEGLTSWCLSRLGNADVESKSRIFLGERLLQVYDDRKPSSRPEDAAISNLAEDTGNAVRWFTTLPPGVKPDLGIIAQLETTNAGVDRSDIGSPVGIGALLRHRIRRQLKAGDGAFLSESRMGIARAPSGEGLADKVMTGIVRLENLVEARYGYTFAPSVHAIQSMLRDKKCDYAAVSSAAVDPACFLGDWLDDAYLWDYDLPSYSHRAGDVNGYYLLSRVKDVDRDSLRGVLNKLPRCGDVEDGFLEEVILEVARRGIPTVRGLAGGNTGAAGDLGLFIAARLLQDEFRRGNHKPRSLLSAISSDGERHEIGLVIPVDPFQGYLEDLQRAVGKGPLLRPDLLVAGIVVSDSAVQCQLTPIEVKLRTQETMSSAACMEALQQAQSLSALLREIRNRADQPDLLLWKLALQHLVLSVVGFGFRVYSQHRQLSQQPREWSLYHQRFVEAVLGDELELTIDPVCRLITIDRAPTSLPRDQDQDGFKETIQLSANDAAQIVRSNAEDLYSGIRSTIGSWRLIPAESPRDSEVTQEVVKPSDTPQAESDKATSQRQVEGNLQGNNSSELRALAVASGIELGIGTTVDGFQSEPRLLNLSDTRLNQLNIGVVGDLGTGKTQLLKSLVYQIAGAGHSNQAVKPRFLIFDYKKDYSSQDFVGAVGARVVKPQHLPINMFDVSGAGDSISPWLDRFKFFSDVLDKIFPGIGPVQRQQLKQAVRQAYDECLAVKKQPTIYDVHAKYRGLLGNKADSPLSIIDDLVDMEMFARDPDGVAGFEQFLDGTVVIALNALGQDDRTKNMLVAIMLNMYYEHMLRIPKRPYIGTNPQLRVIDSFLLVDEADNIMRYEFDVLRKLLLQGREFGVGVILSSQYLRHFKSGATDYREPLLTWFIHKVPNVTPQELGALGLTADTAQLAERVKTLPNHHCLFKTFNVGGDIVRGTPFFELLAR